MLTPTDEFEVKHYSVEQFSAVNNQNKFCDETDFNIPQLQKRWVVNEPLNSLSTRNDVPYTSKMFSKGLRKEGEPITVAAHLPSAIQNDQTSVQSMTASIVIDHASCAVSNSDYVYDAHTPLKLDLSACPNVGPFTLSTADHAVKCRGRFPKVCTQTLARTIPSVLEPNSCHSGRKGKRVRAKRNSNSSNSQHASSNNSASTFTGGKSVSGSGCGGGGDDDRDKKERKKIPRPSPPGTRKFRAWIHKKQKKTRKLSTSKCVKPHVIPVDEKDDTQLQSTSRPPNKETSLVKDNWPQAQQSSHPSHGSLVPPSTRHHTHNHEHISPERKQFEVLIPPTIKAANNATKPVSSKLPKNAQDEQGINNRRQSSALILPGLSYAQVVKGVPLEVTVHPKEPPLNTTDKVGTIMVTGALETSANSDSKVSPPPSTSGTCDTGHQQPVCPLSNGLQGRYSILPADHHDLLVYAVPRYKEFERLAGNAQDPPLHVNPIPPVPDDTLPVEVDIAIPIEGEDVLAVNVLLGPPPAHFPDIELDNEQQGQQAGIIHHQLHVMAGGVQPVEGGNPGSVAYTQSGISKYC